MQPAHGDGGNTYISRWKTMIFMEKDNKFGLVATDSAAGVIDWLLGSATGPRSADARNLRDGGKTLSTSAQESPIKRA